jgi:SAM-dependent methyltransferase
MSIPDDGPKDLDPARAVVFGEDAERYDRARPSYPAPLIDDLAGHGGHRVLDVGCGTGKVGRLLAARGWEVLGVDPDERMAKVARRHGLTVEVASFENWDPAGRKFDLVVSGQAWHWVDPQIGPAKVADVLAPERSLAVIRNRPGYEPAIRARLDEVYRQVAPSIAQSSSVLGTVDDDRTRQAVEAIDGSGRFASIEVRSHPWECVYPADQYLEQLRTHSDHMLLPGERLHELVRRVGVVIAENGGRLTVTFTTTLILAKAKPPGA